MRIPDNSSDEIKEFLSYVSKGVDIETSAAASGLSVFELYSWLERGKVEDDRITGRTVAAKKVEAPYMALWRAVSVSRGKAMAKAQMAVLQAEDPKWQAWWLERSQPEKFAKVSERNALKQLELESGDDHYA